MSAKPNSFKALREKIRLAEIKRRLKAAFRRKPAKPVKEGVV
jgi:hypothetical protein